jgi:hypothetical protein
MILSFMTFHLVYSSAWHWIILWCLKSLFSEFVEMSFHTQGIHLSWSFVPNLPCHIRGSGHKRCDDVS